MDIRSRLPLAARRIAKSKYLIIGTICAVLILVVVLVFYGGASGFATCQIEQIRANLSSCQATLNTTVTERSSCENVLNTTESSLGTCVISNARLNRSFEDCSAEGEELRSRVSYLEEQYNDTIVKSARAICCTPGLASVNWEMSNNLVLCAGSQVIDCSD